MKISDWKEILDIVGKVKETDSWFPEAQYDVIFLSIDTADVPIESDFGERLLQIGCVCDDDYWCVYT